MAKRIIALCGCLAWALTGCMATGIDEEAAEAALGPEEAVHEASSALAPPPPFQILGHTLQGDCKEGDVFVNQGTLDGKPVIELGFTDLSATADDETRDQKLCNVRVHVKSSPGYNMSLAQVFYQGTAEIDADGGSGTASARAYFDGLLGINGYKRLDAGFAGNFDVNVNQGTPPTLCGADTYLNLLVDITARRRASSQGFSEVIIDRGSETTEVKGNAVIRCGVLVYQC